MNLLIVGAGASGMSLGIMAARNGINVSIVEHNKELGKKILSTGNGRCNFTNSCQSLEKYYGNEIAFDIINKFSYEDTLHFFESMGIFALDREGYIYPNSEQASQVREAFALELERLGVVLHTDAELRDIKSNMDKNTYTAILSNSLRLDFDNIAFACGSKAFPKSGSDGSILALLNKLNIKYNEFLPALCPLYCSEKSFFKLASGVRVMAKVKLFTERKKLLEDYGQLQITDYGLSGIPVFQLSSKVSRALHKNEKVEIFVDFLPEIKDKYALLKSRLTLLNLKLAKHLGLGLLPDKLFFALLKRGGIRENKALCDFNNKDIEVLAALTENSKFTVEKTADYDKAQVCTGGVPISDLSENLEHKEKKSIFFVGEIIDADAMCGGYNLQWAWSTSACAARALKEKNKRYNA